jgi:hypothetical protein
MRQGTLIGPIIVAIGLVIAAISFALVGAILKSADGTTELRVERLEGEVRQLSRNLETTDTALRQAQSDAKRLLDDMARIASRSNVQPVTVSPSALEPSPDDHVGVVDMTEVMNLAKNRFNMGVSQPNNRVMLELLGRPGTDLSQECKSVSNPGLAALMDTQQIGPIKVTMVRPALKSLERIMQKLRASEPDIHAAIGTAGAICARFVRGSTRSISNHSWGTAIDIKLENRLDSFGDGGTQFGLLLLAELFNEEGWYWGATYNREDSMHFEVGVETLRAWAAAGKI